MVAPLVDGLSLSVNEYCATWRTSRTPKFRPRYQGNGDFLLFSVGRRVDPACARYYLQLPKGVPGTAWRNLVLPRIVYVVGLILTFLDALDYHSFNHSFDISFPQPVSAFRHVQAKNPRPGFA
jgi:hypothetical protein